MRASAPTSRSERTRARGRQGAFTLIELLVVIAIMALLLSILVPALVSVRDTAKSFVCMDHMRAAAFNFNLFADPSSTVDRGNSERMWGKRFDARDYQESLYEVCEFWMNEVTVYRREYYERGQKPIMCPAGPGGLGRVNGLGSPRYLEYCVGPHTSVCYALNRRLRYAPINEPGLPYPVQRFVTVGSRVLDHPYVPLMFDVDAVAADASNANGASPFFSAPPPRHATEPTVYDNDLYWWPALRHKGRMSVSFVGGHVFSTKDPLEDRSWNWDYHPSIR